MVLAARSSPESDARRGVSGSDTGEDGEGRSHACKRKARVVGLIEDQLRDRQEGLGMAKPEDCVFAVAGPGAGIRTWSQETSSLKSLDDHAEPLAHDEHLIAQPVINERILGGEVGGESNAVDDERLATVSSPRRDRCP